MIAHAMTTVATLLNQHLGQHEAAPSPDLPWVESAPPSPAEGLRLSLILTKEDVTLKSVTPHLQEGATRHAAPEAMALHLLVMLSAQHAHYTTALHWLDQAMHFFQASPVLSTPSPPAALNHSRSAPMPWSPLEITCHPHPLSLQETQQLWQAFDLPLQPHACYWWRCRQLPAVAHS